MLPNKEKGSVCINKYGDMYSGSFSDCTNYELYFTSDDKIGEDDWVYDKRPNENGIFKDIVYQKVDIECNLKSSTERKIISTTDSSLKLKVVDKNHSKPIDSGIPNKYKNILLPQPSQAFIEKYIEGYNKGNTITDVLVEYEENPYWGRKNELKEIIKVNSKDNTINIKQIKDSWNKEELQELKQDILHLCVWYQGRDVDRCIRVEKWVEENL